MPYALLWKYYAIQRSFDGFLSIFRIFATPLNGLSLFVKNGVSAFVKVTGSCSNHFQPEAVFSIGNDSVKGTKKG